MAKALEIKIEDLKNDKFEGPSRLQMYLFTFMQHNELTLNQMSAQTGLHHHTLKTLLLSNGSSQKLTRATKLMLGRELCLSEKEIERMRDEEYIFS